MSDESTTEGVGGKAGAPKDMLDAVGRKFGPFFALFGSGAAVTALLLSAGFLSDFSAYRLAGLPRLSFSATALAETGAEVVVDTFSLLAGGLRIFVLVAMLIGVIFLWAFYDARRVRPFTTSVPLYRAFRLLALVAALFIFGSLVDRTQRSLTGDEYSSTTIENALRAAYSDHFPDPLERQIALERPGYELRFYRVPNWAADAEREWRGLLDWLRAKLGKPLDAASYDNVQGIPLRVLAESRTAARHVYGWLALSLVVLVAAVVLLGWWGRWLKASQARRLARNTDGPDDQGTAGRWRSRFATGLRAIRHALERCLEGNMAAPIERLVGPMTFLLTVVSLALLPLAHGALARPYLGGENVMVYLAAQPAPSAKSTPTDPREKTVAGTDRFNCSQDTLEGLSDARQLVSEAMRDYAQTRPTVEEEFQQKRLRYAEHVQAFAMAVIASNCGEAVREFWAAQPPTGLAAQAPDIAELYRHSLLRVTNAFSVRLGTILTYPRDTQPLTLVENIVPKQEYQSGQWSVQALERQAVSESVVLPNVLRRRLSQVSQLLQFEPDHDSRFELLVAPTPDALEIALNLLEQRRLTSKTAGVAVTAAGTMAWVSAYERPDLARRAIDYLADLADAAPSAYWPDKDEDIRGTAATGLHLTRNPYAAYSFAGALDRSGPLTDCSVDNGRPRHLGCIGTSTTAAGYLLQDVSSEMKHFVNGPVPAPLARTQHTLLAYLVAIVVSHNVSDEVRGAACTALGLAGAGNPSLELRERFWSELREADPSKYPFSTPACILQMHAMRLDGPHHRQYLREVLLGKWKKPASQSDARNIEEAAFLSLRNVGLSGESELIFDLYAHPERSKVGKLVSGRLADVAPEPLAKRLLGCAQAADTPVADRARCLNGFTKLHVSFVGDDGTAAAIREIAAKDDAELRTAACSALQAFSQRGGRWVMRRAREDDVVRGCVAQEQAEPKSDSERLLEMLREAAKPAARSQALGSF
jgi:hypothetical protein